jgi:hypothetical protein
MSEYAGALTRLNAQLARAGVSTAHARTAIIAYTAALSHRSELTWHRFYLAIYAALEALAERPLPFAGRVAAPLIALIEDDFGSRLFPVEARERIRRRLVEYDLREASLSP